MPDDPNNPTPDVPPIPDTSQLPDQSPANQYALQNANVAMQPQPSPPVVAQPGALKQLLTNFIGGGARAMMVHVGLPTPEQEQQRQQQQQQAAQASQATIQYHQALADNLKSQNEEIRIPRPPAADGTPVPDLVLPRKYSGQVAIEQMKEAAQQPKPINVAGVGAFVWDPQLKDYKKVQGTGGLEIPIDRTTAEAAGIPEMAGRPIGKQGWGVLNAGLQARGFHVVDTGKSGPNDGMWVFDKLGNRINQISPNSIAVARGQGYAAAKAANTPFQTFDAEGNLITVSQAQALQTGAPSATAYQTLYGPTGATKTAGQAAGAVSSHIPEFKQSVQNLAAQGKLGMVQGRINEYMNRGYGGDDPDIANFVTTLKLLNSGTVRAHFGARGGQQILASFNNILNTAQEPQAILGSIDAIDSFLKTYGDVGTLKGPKTGIAARGGGAEPPRPAQVPAGYKFNAKGPKGPGWYKP